MKRAEDLAVQDVEAAIGRAEAEDARLTPLYLALLRAEKLSVEQRAELEATGRTIHGVRAARGAYATVWAALESAIRDQRVDSMEIARLEHAVRVRRRALELAIDGVRDYCEQARREVVRVGP